MTDNALSNLFKAQADSRAARNLRDFAAAQVDLFAIKERFAEIVSQHEPLATLTGTDDTMCAEYKARRKAMIDAATFVVFGRVP